MLLSVLLYVYNIVSTCAFQCLRNHSVEWFGVQHSIMLNESGKKRAWGGEVYNSTPHGLDLESASWCVLKNVLCAPKASFLIQTAPSSPRPATQVKPTLPYLSLNKLTKALSISHLELSKTTSVTCHSLWENYSGWRKVVKTKEKGKEIALRIVRSYDSATGKALALFPQQSSEVDKHS